ncbi:Calcium channel YVC1 [Vanrija pseudolonga]|uniref:Calcium channel YVC1 n=1 Tax=Vanrija pseudolonga TaxID=143232 RepID=A0AAF0Y7Y9_9TREE|nr:Calcium channel YVC1 [Vanrija pseudolonga]
MASQAEDQRSILSTVSVHPSSDTITKLVKRIRALTYRLLPVEVELNDITAATSSIITPEVVAAYAKAGGDFREAVPFCLLRARSTFLDEGSANPADYEESQCRATACEVLARRMVHRFPKDRLPSVMSGRFRWRTSDGGESASASALEVAIDGHCTIFLSSNEAQSVVNALWKGLWVQKNNEDERNDIDYIEYHHPPETGSGFWKHFNPDRLSVPRYQSIFRVVIWFVFLFIYQMTIQSPADATDPLHEFDGWEIALYTMAFAFLLQELIKAFKTYGLATNPLVLLSFWTIVSFTTYVLLLVAFGLRVFGTRLEDDDDDRAKLHFRSFQVLSCVGPLIWIRLLTVFEGYKVIGVLQVVVFRMLRESAIFFILLFIMAIGFAQALYALDTADGETNSTGFLVNSLLQALLMSPDYGDYMQPDPRFGYPFGLIIYYSWCFIVGIVLVNVLIALFGSAYSDVSDNATDEYLTFFAGKTVDLIRAPDHFVYQAPFNLIEIFLIAPWEYVIPYDSYVRLNRYAMTVLFFVPLTLIAVYESAIHGSGRLHNYFAEPIPEDEDDPKVINPTSDDPAGEITRVPFDELIKAFPDTTMTESAVILEKISSLRRQLEQLEKELKK